MVEESGGGKKEKNAGVMLEELMGERVLVGVKWFICDRKSHGTGRGPERGVEKVKLDDWRV